MPISKNIDWNAIKDKKQKAITKSNLRENSKRKQINYNPGDWILIKNLGIIRKLAVPYDGPYKVVKHNSNGTITYKKILHEWQSQCTKNKTILLEKPSRTTHGSHAMMMMCIQPKWRPTETLKTYPFLINWTTESFTCRQYHGGVCHIQHYTLSRDSRLRYESRDIYL